MAPSFLQRALYPRAEQEDAIEHFSQQQPAGGKEATTRVLPTSEPCSEKHVPHFQSDFGFNFKPWVIMLEQRTCLCFTSSPHGEKISKIDCECRSIKVIVPVVSLA